MKPTWKIEANGADITEKIKDRLLSLTVKDEAGSKSDTVDIELDDRDHLCPLPKMEETLKIYIGWESPEYMGTYVIDEIGIKGNAKSVTVRGKASEEAPKYKEPITTSWDKKTIQEIVSTIAGRHGLQPIVHPKYAGRLIDHIDQSEESDSHFLTRLGKQQGAVAKVADGKLIFTEANSSTTPSGTPIKPVTVKATETKEWRATVSGRGDYKEVTAKWQDQASGREQWVKVGTGAEKGSEYKDRRLYRTKKEALEASQAKLKDLTSGKIALDLTLAIGNPVIFAEGSITLEGFRDPIEGETLIIKSVTHKVAGDGFTTQVTAGNKGDEGSEQASSQ
jgi:phage protein D